MKIKISSIMAFLIYHVIFISMYYVPQYSLLVYIFCGILLVMLCCKIKYFINKRYSKVNILIFSFVAMILFSAFYNRVNMQRGVIYAIKVLEIFLFWEYVHQKNEQKTVVKVFLYLTVFYLIITDILLFISPNLYKNNSRNYLIGNKFYVSYLHILLLIFYSYYKSSRNDIRVKCVKIFLLVWAIAIAFVTDCSTAVTGCALILLLKLIIKRKNIKNLSNPKMFMITLFVSCSLLLCFSGILHTKPIKFLIVNVLHEDLTLTGRLYIYENDFDIISKKLFLGHGYGNSYDVMYSAIKAPNTQNALLECLLNFGILGTIALLLLMYRIFKDYNKCNEMDSIIIYLYVFSILGMIEITINITFIALLAMLNNGKINSLVGEKN